MSDDDEPDLDGQQALQLNTLHRFRKHSPRLLLEEYSHCEVPAGCGGVVMRWVDPDAGTPAVVRVFVEARATLWLNGELIESGRVDVACGPNVLAVALDEIVAPESGLRGLIGQARPPALMLSIVRALGTDVASGEEAVVLLSSGRASVWRIRADEPPAGWTALDFDDSDWREAERTELAPERESAWHAQQLRGHGAYPLALPRDRAWLRVGFDGPRLQAEDA